MDMLKKYRGGIEITCGKYFVRIEPTEISVSKEAIAEYEKHLEDLNWIRNDRMRAWIVTKLIRGEAVRDIMNKVFDKGHLYDMDYRNLIV
jgi:hypothetical protein